MLVAAKKKLLFGRSKRRVHSAFRYYLILEFYHSLTALGDIFFVGRIYNINKEFQIIDPVKKL